MPGQRPIAINSLPIEMLGENDPNGWGNGVVRLCLTTKKNLQDYHEETECVGVEECKEH